MKKRKIWIDATKGFGIILVMISHFCFIPEEYQYFIAGHNVFHYGSIFKRIENIFLTKIFVCIE